MTFELNHKDFRVGLFKAKDSYIFYLPKNVKEGDIEDKDELLRLFTKTCFFYYKTNAPNIDAKQTHNDKSSHHHIHSQPKSLDSINERSIEVQESEQTKGYDLNANIYLNIASIIEAPDIEDMIDLRSKYDEPEEIDFGELLDRNPIFLPNGAIFCEDSDMLLDRPALREDADIVLLFAFLHTDVRDFLQMPVDHRWKYFAQEFKTTYLYEDASLFGKDDEYIDEYLIEDLKDIFMRIVKNTRYKDRYFNELQERIEKFLFFGEEGDDTPVVGTYDFHNIWEELNLRYFQDRYEELICFYDKNKELVKRCSGDLPDFQSAIPDMVLRFDEKHFAIYDWKYTSFEDYENNGNIWQIDIEELIEKLRNKHYDWRDCNTKNKLLNDLCKNITYELLVEKSGAKVCLNALVVPGWNAKKLCEIRRYNIVAGSQTLQKELAIIQHNLHFLMRHYVLKQSERESYE